MRMLPPFSMPATLFFRLRLRHAAAITLIFFAMGLRALLIISLRCRRYFHAGRCFRFDAAMPRCRFSIVCCRAMMLAPRCLRV